MLSFGLRLKLQIAQTVIVACNNNDIDPPDLLDMILPDNENISNLTAQEIEDGNARQHLIQE